MITGSENVSADGAEYFLSASDAVIHRVATSLTGDQMLAR